MYHKLMLCKIICIFYFCLFSEDDKSVSSESSDGSDAYLDNVLTQKEGNVLIYFTSIPINLLLVSAFS